MLRSKMIAILIAGLFGIHSVTTAQLVTSISPAGSEHTDGDLVVFPFFSPFPNAPPQPSDGFRFQELHPTAFDSMGSGPFFITSMAWRPDSSVNGPVFGGWEVEALNLSTTTTEPGSMSLTFSDNYGPGGATTVFSGTMQFQTEGVPTGGGLPHDFDYVFDFDVPYRYDPAQGNLLFEFIATTENPWIWTDGAGQSQFTFALSPAAEVANFAAPGIIVTQFSAVPDPSTLLQDLLADVVTMDLPNGISTALGTKLNKTLDFWQSDNPQPDAIHHLEQFLHFVGNHDATRIPTTDAELLVNSTNEIIDAMEVLGQFAAVPPSSNVQAIPEPSTAILLTIAGFASLGVSALRRRRRWAVNTSARATV